MIAITRTLGEDLPFTRFTSWRVGEDLIQLVEQILHLATTLSLGHLVANAELWGATVVPAALCHRSRVKTLEAGHAAVLHRVVVRCGDVCRTLGMILKNALDERAII